MEELRLPVRGEELDREPAFPRREFRELGERRLLGLSTARRWGGRGLPLRDAATTLHALAYRSGTTFAKLSMQPEFCSLLAEHGSDSLRSEFFDPLLTGQRLVGNHVTEPGAGSDIGGLAMRATRSGEEYILDGTKSEAAFAVDADAAIVYAKVREDAVSAFLVPQGLEGIERTLSPPDLGERWMRRGTVRYAGVRVPVGHRIGPEGGALDLLKGELTRDRLFLAVIYLGVGRSSFDDVVEYAGTRATFGRPLHAHQAVGFPIADDWARLDATWLYVERSLVRLEAGEDVAAEAALAKRMATTVALAAIDHAVQFHGGRGYSSALPHERRWRDVRSGALAHGPNELMLRTAAGRLWPRAPRPP
ncbi:MAG: acyl-CoA dehydrogenase family protein [Thermoplasmata archaeon]|nr:acyl-CoA dehydrogenase family protein [Thermoplasmata archaeon]MCI4332560.1 acyl-CoA dehydrogenase family protein [Thermoplasmata archaeon]